MRLEFPRQNFENKKFSNFIKIRSVGVKVLVLEDRKMQIDFQKLAPIHAKIETFL
jgi:transcription termination factor Rho